MVVVEMKMYESFRMHRKCKLAVSIRYISPEQNPRNFDITAMK